MLLLKNTYWARRRDGGGASSTKETVNLQTNNKRMPPKKGDGFMDRKMEEVLYEMRIFLKEGKTTKSGGDCKKGKGSKYIRQDKPSRGFCSDSFLEPPPLVA